MHLLGYLWWKQSACISSPYFFLNPLREKLKEEGHLLTIWGLQLTRWACCLTQCLGPAKSKWADPFGKEGNVYKKRKTSGNFHFLQNLKKQWNSILCFLRLPITISTFTFQNYSNGATPHCKGGGWAYPPWWDMTKQRVPEDGGSPGRLPLLSFLKLLV